MTSSSYNHKYVHFLAFFDLERATREHDLVFFRLCENTHTHTQGLPVTVLHLCTVSHTYERGVSGQRVRVCVFVGVVCGTMLRDIGTC